MSESIIDAALVVVGLSLLSALAWRIYAVAMARFLRDDVIATAEWLVKGNNQ